MTIPPNPQENFTPFLPTTINYPEEEERLKTFLVDIFANYGDVINDKKIGLYLQLAETFNGNKFFYDTLRTRNGYQYLARITQYPNNTTLTLAPPSDINDQFRITNIWGSASKPPTALNAGNGDYFSYMAKGDTRVSFTMSDTAIVVTTTLDLTAYDGYIIIEYVRDGS